ncbi:MAG: DnaB-like helicase C-terminal domain-containing protein [Gemmataceae bacterium]
MTAGAELGTRHHRGPSDRRQNTFALNLIRNIITGRPAARQSPVVVFFSLEMARIELAERLLCCPSRVDSHKVRRAPEPGRHPKARGGRRRASQGQALYRRHAQPHGSDRRELPPHHEEAREGRRAQLVVIDYLQLIEPENRRDPRQEQVAQISRRLKFLAKELNIPVIALAQVNRSSEDRQDHKPRLSDLRESGSIEQDADTCMMLHRPGMFDKGDKDAEKVLEIIIAKQRNGPTGEITLTYLKQFNRFENYIADVGYGGDGL